jgi:hypothetical protein
MVIAEALTLITAAMFGSAVAILFRSIGASWIVLRYPSRDLHLVGRAKSNCVTLLRDAAKVGTPSSAGRSSQLTAAPVRPRVRWAVARIGERELSGAGSASDPGHRSTEEVRAP